MIGLGYAIQTLPYYPIPSGMFLPTMPVQTTPSSAPPPSSFVDLPDSSRILNRGHMFTSTLTPHSLAAAAVAAAADTSRHPLEGMLQELIRAQGIRGSDFSFLLAAGLPGQGGESAPIGAAQRDIEKYTTTAEWVPDPEAEAAPCTVCMSDFEQGETVRTLTCHHAFHVPCIDRWLSYNKKCPNCRVDLDKPSAAPVAEEAATETSAAAATAPTAAAAATPQPQQADGSAA